LVVRSLPGVFSVLVRFRKETHQDATPRKNAVAKGPG